MEFTIREFFTPQYFSSVICYQGPVAWESLRQLLSKHCVTGSFLWLDCHAGTPALLSWLPVPRSAGRVTYTDQVAVSLSWPLFLGDIKRFMSTPFRPGRGITPIEVEFYSGSLIQEGAYHFLTLPGKRPGLHRVTCHLSMCPTQCDTEGKDNVSREVRQQQVCLEMGASFVQEIVYHCPASIVLKPVV